MCIFVHTPARFGLHHKLCWPIPWGIPCKRGREREKDRKRERDSEERERERRERDRMSQQAMHASVFS